MIIGKIKRISIACINDVTKTRVKHVAKGLNLSNIILPDEINNMISLKKP